MPKRTATASALYYSSTLAPGWQRGYQDPRAVEDVPPMPTEQVTVEQPKHRLTQLTTYELRDHRKELESAIAFFDKQDPVPPARGRLQARLDAVLAEQDDRARLANARA
jgi:hypothetical protein